MSQNKYYVTSIDYNVLGDELDVTLCELDGKVEFRQPHFERAWNVLLFDTEIDALLKLRQLYEGATLTLFEETGRVLTHTNAGRESWFTTMTVKAEL